MRVLFTPSGREQFLEALDFIRRDNPAAAARLLKKARKALKRLEDSPGSGRVIPEFPELPHREVVIPPYRFFYKVKGRMVWVVAVSHSARLVGDPEVLKGRHGAGLEEF